MDNKKEEDGEPDYNRVFCQRRTGKTAERGQRRTGKTAERGQRGARGGTT